MNDRSTRGILNSLTTYTLAKEVAVDIYTITETIPAKEKYNIIDQIRRSVISIGANIAEGYLRQSAKDTSRFFRISKASLAETIFLLEIATDLGYLTEPQTKHIHDKLRQLDVKIFNFTKSL